MKRTYRNVFVIVTILLSIACGALAVLWPQWKGELQAYYYYQEEKAIHHRVHR